MVKLSGITLVPDPLAFLFFSTGPDCTDGDACRELRGVKVVEVVCDGFWGIAKGLMLWGMKWG